MILSKSQSIFHSYRQPWLTILYTDKLFHLLLNNDDPYHILNFVNNII